MKIAIAGNRMSPFAVAAVTLLACMFSSAAEEAPSKSVKNDEHPTIAFLSTRTGAPRRIDQTYGLFEWTADLFVTNFEGKELVNITQDPANGAGGAQWSPDGRYLCWVTRRGLWILGDGQKKLLLSTDDGCVYSHDWSPDSQGIAYCGSAKVGEPRTWRSGIFLVGLSGQAPKMMMEADSNMLVQCTSVQWLRHSNALLLQHNSGLVEIAPILEDGSLGERRVIFRSPEGRVAGGVAVSPDESLCALPLSVPEDRNRYGIWVFGINWEQGHFLNDLRGMDQSQPSWCPADKNIVAFIGRETGPNALYLNCLDSKKAKRITLEKPYSRISSYHWSPDGKRIALECERQDMKIGGETDILLLDLASMTMRRFIGSGDARNIDAAWRPQRAGGAL